MDWTLVSGLFGILFLAGAYLARYQSEWCEQVATRVWRSTLDPNGDRPPLGGNARTLRRITAPFDLVVGVTLLSICFSRVV